MPIPEKYRVDFEAEGIFHIYNRTNNKELLFPDDMCYEFFLHRAIYYLLDFMEILCYSLIPNHFHFIVKLRSYETIVRNINRRQLKKTTLVERKFVKNEITLSVLIENAFKRLFQSYTQTINRKFNRRGNLFYKNFKRLKVDCNNYFTQLIVYVLANSVKHGIVTDFEKYKWSSIEELMNRNDSSSGCKIICDWFGGRDKAIEAIRSMVTYYYTSDYSIEE